MPRTRSRGKPEARIATWHMASSGLVTTIRIASGETAAAWATTLPTIPAFLASRSSRLIPGWRARPGRHDDDVRARGVRVVVGADDPGVVPDDRRRLREVEALALRQPFDDVDEDDIREAGLGDPLGGGGADVSGADDGDLVASHDARNLQGRAGSIQLPVARRAPGQPSPGADILMSPWSSWTSIGPASRIASLTPSAYRAKFSWNIVASLRAAAS